MGFVEFMAMALGVLTTAFVWALVVSVLAGLAVTTLAFFVFSGRLPRKW